MSTSAAEPQAPARRTPSTRSISSSTSTPCASPAAAPMDSPPPTASFAGWPTTIAASGSARRTTTSCRSCPAAVLFDLGVGGRFRNTPDAAFGERASCRGTPHQARPGNRRRRHGRPRRTAQGRDRLGERRASERDHGRRPRGPQLQRQRVRRAQRRVARGRPRTRRRVRPRADAESQGRRRPPRRPAGDPSAEHDARRRSPPTPRSPSRSAPGWRCPDRTAWRGRSIRCTSTSTATSCSRLATGERRGPRRPKATRPPISTGSPDRSSSTRSSPPAPTPCAGRSSTPRSPPRAPAV